MSHTLRPVYVLCICLSAAVPAGPASLCSPCIFPLSLRLSALPVSLRQQNVLFCPLKALSENPNRLYKLFKFSILIMSTYLRTNFTDPVLNIWILFVFENLPYPKGSHRPAMPSKRELFSGSIRQQHPLSGSIRQQHPHIIAATSAYNRYACQDCQDCAKLFLLSCKGEG